MVAGLLVQVQFAALLLLKGNEPFRRRFPSGLFRVLVPEVRYSSIFATFNFGLVPHFGQQVFSKTQYHHSNFAPAILCVI